MLCLVILHFDIHVAFSFSSNRVCLSCHALAMLRTHYTRTLIAIFENYVAEIRLDGKAVQLALWDTAYVPFPSLSLHISTLKMHPRGQEEYEVGSCPYSWRCE